MAACATAAVISVFTALAFMHTFVQASMTSMYVKIWEKDQGQGGNKEQGYKEVS